MTVTEANTHTHTRLGKRIRMATRMAKMVKVCVLALCCNLLARLPTTATAWTNPNTFQRRLLSPPPSLSLPSLRTLPSLRLGATIEDQISEDESETGPAPRRTRRIDDILEDYEVTGDAAMTISVLESSLKREQEKASTLAVRLAYAEQVIEEQKQKLRAERNSLQAKTLALSETQKKLKALEDRLSGRQQQRQQQQRQQQRQQQQPQPPIQTAEGQYPLITDWFINRTTGEVKGKVSGHPSIPDGTTIVTSGLDPDSFGIAMNPNFVYDPTQSGPVVTTRSGTMYQLGAKKPTRPQQPQQQPQQSQASMQQQERQQQQLQRRINPNISFNLPLTGQSISNGRGTKYLLAGDPKRKPSGRSEIVLAFKCDDQLRVCDSVTPYVVKLSTHKDKLQREYENYCRVQEQTVSKNNGGWMGALFGDRAEQQTNAMQSSSQSSQGGGGDLDPFVTCFDFLPVCEGSIKYAQHSAIILEKGHEDLRDYEFNLQIQDDPEYPTPIAMDPSIVRSALLVAAKCLDVLHSKARLVWTDLKAENLIFMEPQTEASDGTIVDIKGVDLESAIPHRGNPLDYTPEACPPEFAKFHLKGKAYDFVLDYSYDVWSFGMLAYELATGRAYFKGRTPSEIMSALGSPQFIPPLGSVQETGLLADPQLQDLIQSCLKMDPRKRLSVRKILRHPYFQQPQPPAAAQGQAPYGGGYGDAAAGGTFW